MARRFVTPAQRKRRILRDVLLLAAVLVVLALRLDFPILTANQALEAAQVRYFFGPGRVIAALDRRNEHYRYDRYYILQDGDWYAWCEVSRNPGQPFWNPGILLAVENAPELPLVPLVVDGWRDGLILVISNDPEIARVEVRLPASGEDSPGLSLFSVSQTQKTENCFLVSYSTSGLYAHYPEDLQVMGYDSSGKLLYQSPVPESWATRYELR